MEGGIDVPVLIAGGGPVGMTLSLELARYGVASMVAERNPTTTKHPKMDLTNARSMELFARLGIAEALRDAGVPRANCFDISWVTSLSGHEILRFRYPSADGKLAEIQANNDGTEPSAPPLRASQIMIEPVIKAAIDADPLVDVRFGHRFKRLVRQDEAGVVAELEEVATGRVYEVRSRYLAACDGGGSMVRSGLGINVEGQYEAAAAYMIHFRSDDRALLQRWGTTWHHQNPEGVLIAQNDRDVWTLHVWITPEMEPATMTPQGVLEGWVGRPFEYEILQANPWFSHFVVAESYVAGSVALAGDAAHQFVPTGGYGMNTGIADAAGLGWMLAALVQGWGGPRLLAAHDAERRPVAWQSLAASRRHVETRMAINEVFAAAGYFERPDDQPMRDRLAVELARIGNAENESWGVEIGYRYDASPIVCNDPAAPPFDPLRVEPSAIAGARLPHIVLADGRSLHQRLGRYFTLLCDGAQDTAAYETTARELGIPLAIERIDEPIVRDVLKADLILVRPDQHIAWRGETLPEPAPLLRRVTGHLSADG